jgi:hypothetical protein
MLRQGDAPNLLRVYPKFIGERLDERSVRRRNHPFTPHGQEMSDKY